MAEGLGKKIHTSSLFFSDMDVPSKSEMTSSVSLGLWSGLSSTETVA